MKDKRYIVPVEVGTEDHHYVVGLIVIFDKEGEVNFLIQCVHI